MSRFSGRTYRIQILALSAIYMVLIFFAWPYARSSTSLLWKSIFSISPALPMLAVIALMAKRVVDSDELAQRVHLIALSVATGLVGSVSLIVGLMCAAGVIDLQGDILIWVFPMLCLSYGLTRWLVGRSYGGNAC